MERCDFYVVLLAGAVHAMLQLGAGALLLLYHASLGKHIKKKTRQLASQYILGNALLTMLSVAAVSFIILVVNQGELGTLPLMILVGALAALAIAAWAFYYRRGRSTELWLPRTVSRYISRRAKKTESSTEAFSLGMLTCFAEMPFTLILIVVAANSVLALPQAEQILAIALYTLLSVLPLAVMRLMVRRGETVADIQKWRIKNKNFLKIMTGIGFLTLALFIVAFKVMTEAR